MVAYGTSAAGSENSVLRFMETATGKVLPEALDRAQMARQRGAATAAGYSSTG